MVPERFRIRSRVDETPDTFTMELEGVESTEFEFRPGQFNMLYMFGVGEVPISISGNPQGSGPVVHTVRGAGTVSKALANLDPGAMVGLRGPYGNPWPSTQVRGDDIVIMAGGLGLAPLRPLIYEVLSHREHYGRVNIVYGARTPGDLLFKEELRQWRSRFDLELHVTVDAADSEWNGDVGLVTGLLDFIRFDPDHTTAFVCGPEIMMKFGVLALKAKGLVDSSIFISTERNMKCAVGYCGHCQWGPEFVCKDGPVFSFERIEPWFGVRQL